MNYRYVTLLTSDTYVNGVLLLKETLRMTASKYSLLCLITDNLSTDTLTILKKANIETKLVSMISMPEKLYEHNYKINAVLTPTWKNTFTKFHIWELEEYDKIIFLDADLYINKNIDSCFELPDMTAAVDGEYFNLWPNDLHFNSGFMVIKPSTYIYSELIKYITALVPNSIRDYLDRPMLIADQDVLNLYFNNWKTCSEQHLNKYYNVFAPYILEDMEAELLNNAYFIHFVGVKPWDLLADGTAKIALYKNIQSLYFYEKAAGIVEYLYKTDFKAINWDNITDLYFLMANLTNTKFKNPEDVKKFFVDETFIEALDVKNSIVHLLTHIYKKNITSGVYIFDAIQRINQNDIETTLLYYSIIEDAVKNSLSKF